MGYIKLVRNRLKNKLVIVGQEVFTESLHVIALGIEELIDHNLSIENTLRNIHEQGGLAVAVHPVFSRLGPLKFFNSLSCYDFDAVEGFNGLLSPFVIPNYLSIIASRLKNIPCIYASDSHTLKFIGTSFIDIPCDNVNDTSGIFELIKKGKFITHKKSYFDLRYYIKAAKGNKCVICAGKVGFKKDYSYAACYKCGKTDRSNFVCDKGHYVCEPCFLNIR